jgi:hypothetical protein
MPKRVGHLFEKIASMDNLRLADKEAQSGKVKINRAIRRHNAQAEKDLLELRRMILENDFPDEPYSEMEVISDSGKRRKISKQHYFPWRILHHAVIRVVTPYLLPSLIPDTFACIKGKGLHYGVRRMKRMMRRYPEYRWFWKTDYKKFYQCIPHDVLIWALRRKFKDERLIRLIETAILNFETDDDTLKDIHDEEIRKARNAYWRLSKPIACEHRHQRNRPLDERGRSGQMLLALLR